MFCCIRPRNLTAWFDDPKSFSYQNRNSRTKIVRGKHWTTILTNRKTKKTKTGSLEGGERWRLSNWPMSSVWTVHAWRNQSPAWAWTASTSHSWQERDTGASLIFKGEKWKRHKTEETETRKKDFAGQKGVKLLLLSSWQVLDMSQCYILLLI